MTTQPWDKWKRRNKSRDYWRRKNQRRMSQRRRRNQRRRNQRRGGGESEEPQLSPGRDRPWMAMILFTPTPIQMVNFS